MAEKNKRLLNTKEDHQARITVVGQNKVEIPNLRCKFYLPEKHTGKVTMYILPTWEESRVIEENFSGFWKFSFSSDEPALVGESEQRVLISASEVYSAGINTRMWGPEMGETVWLAEPVDLRVVYTLPGRNHPTEARFWLTPNSLLNTGMMISRSYTGDVDVKRVREKQFTLANGVELNFTHHFRHREESDKSTRSWSYLVAESNLRNDPEASLKIDQKLVKEIDDFLLIASLATRERSVCVGWEVFDHIGHTTFFRRDISIPKPESDYSRNDELIDRPLQEEFLRFVYPQFANDSSLELVRDAVRAAIPRRRQVLESRFTSLFSAVETLILSYRRKNGLEYVFNDEEERSQWKLIKDRDLREWLKNQPLLSGADKGEKRKLIYENLSALERISFGHALTRFCEFYSVDLSDLWPISGGSSGWSLTVIRNKLAHGESLPSYKYGSLMVATEHLQWTLERLILGYFGWDFQKSNISRRYLSQFMNAHQNMTSERARISS